MADRLGDARRANGVRIEKQRRGADNAAARRANGDRLESSRRGVTVQDEINSLVRPVAVRKQLKTVPPLGALPAKRGRANYKAPATVATGGGIASPLTEPSYAAREFHPEKSLKSSDGLFVWEFAAVKKVVMTDANGEPVVQIFAEPS
jgi:hypothetical protein